jgi:lipopolysaccharide/colanic/teichoic acid biosynthesis glycosyltransferase
MHEAAPSTLASFSIYAGKYPFIPTDDNQVGIYVCRIRPVADWILALLAAPFALLICLPAAVALSIANGGPIFFRQWRPGLYGQAFQILKFKTMSDARNSEGHLLSDAVRLHATGRLIRKLSVDELPQLWNVLCGELALIGPRPLLMQYLPLYTAEQAKRHWVRPGITGLAQARGRNEMPWKARFELDVYYVAHASFRLDMQIIWETVGRVIGGKGVTASGEATVAPFKGND